MSPARIRVLHLAHVINRDDVVDTILSRLDRSRFEPAALAGTVPHAGGSRAEREQYPLRVLHLEFRRRSYPRMLVELLREIRSFRPDLVHAHHFDENLVAALAFRLSSVGGYVLGRHYSDQMYLWSRGIRRRIFLAAENFSNRTASRIVVPHESVARLLIERQGVDPRKIEVIPHGIDFDRRRDGSSDAPGRIRREAGLEHRFIILYCGRLIWIKAVDDLLRAMGHLKERIPNAALVVIGTGPARAKLETLTEDLGLTERVRFLGWRTDALDWMAAADVLVSPSLTESFGQVLVEALGQGTPVVATPLGVAPDVIGDQEHGRLVAPRTPEALVAAIEELHGDAEARRRMGELGRHYVRTHYRVESMVEQYERLYERIAGLKE